MLDQAVNRVYNIFVALCSSPLEIFLLHICRDYRKRPLVILLPLASLPFLVVTMATIIFDFPPCIICVVVKQMSNVIALKMHLKHLVLQKIQEVSKAVMRSQQCTGSYGTHTQAERGKVCEVVHAAPSSALWCSSAFTDCFTSPKPKPWQILSLTQRYSSSAAGRWSTLKQIALIYTNTQSSGLPLNTSYSSVFLCCAFSVFVSTGLHITDRNRPGSVKTI